MANHWAISDTHWNHANILKFYPEQPFKTLEERNEALITRWNEVVKPEDRVYHLGDVTMSRGAKPKQEEFIKLIKSLNGHKAKLFVGNHDHMPTQTYLDAGFEMVMGTHRDDHPWIFSHFPLHPSSLQGVKANIHGHIHGNAGPPPAVFTKENGSTYIVPYINVSVEVVDYRPISFDEIAKRIQTARQTYVHLQQETAS